MSSDDSTIKITSREEAKELGLKRYFDGEPCRKGHIAEKYTRNNKCVECRKIAKTKWASEHPDILRQVKESWRLRNMDKMRIYAARTRKRHPETTKMRIRRWRDNNQDKVLEYRNSDKGRESAKRSYKKYSQTEHGKLVVRTALYKRRATKKKAVGHFSLVDMRMLLQQQKKCYICGKRFTKSNRPTFDHVRALADGGSNEPSNIALACHPCNIRKGKKRMFLI